MQLLRKFAFATLIVLSAAVIAGAQSWQPLTHQPNFTAGPMLLLTDGTVMVQHQDINGGHSEWYKLTPDINGSYVNGTWSQLASLSSNYGPAYFASAVLADGRMIIEGGEQNFTQYVWTNLGAIYDPLADTWTPMTPPAGWNNIGDASSVVLFNKKLMLANCCTAQQAILDPMTLTWTPTGTGKADGDDEEGWTLRHSGKVLIVDAYTTDFKPNGTNSKMYDPNTGAWSSA